MKRGLVFSLSALALVAYASAAQAQVPTTSVSLNLRYTDPADPSEGGTWYLVAKTTGANGLAGLSAYFNNINTAGMLYGNAGAVDTRYGTPGSVTDATLAAILNGGQPFNANFSGAINVVYGQDTASGPIILDVGQGAGTPGNVATDPLGNATWNNSAIIANGTFGATRPVFVTAGANVTDSNVLTNASTTPPNNFATPAAVASPAVRGDSLASLGLNTPANAGLLAGDSNRDRNVNVTDFNTLAFNFGDPGTFGWDQGDFNDDNTVNVNDFNLLAFNFADPSPPAPTVGAVPEPATLGLFGLGLVSLAALRRRMA